MKSKIIIIAGATLVAFKSFSQEPVKETRTLYYHPTALFWNEYKCSFEVKPNIRKAYEYSASLQLPTVSDFYHEELNSDYRLSTTRPFINKLRTSIGVAYGVKRFGANHPKNYWGYETVLRYLWYHDKYMAYYSGTGNKEWVGKYSVDQLLLGEMIQIGTAPSLKVGPSTNIVFDFYLGVGIQAAYNSVNEWDYKSGSSNVNDLSIGSSPNKTENTFIISPTAKFGVKIGLQRIK